MKSARQGMEAYNGENGNSPQPVDIGPVFGMGESRTLFFIGLYWHPFFLAWRQVLSIGKA
jgi:hypothetical protein